MSRLLDTHFHLELFENYLQIADEIERLGIYTLAVSNAPSFYDGFRVRLGPRRFIRQAVGLHPELVRTHGHELPLLLERMSEVRYVGEVGLDYSPPHRASAVEQRKVFAATVARAREVGGRVLTIHSRGAEAEVLEVLGENFPGMALLHWYSGNARTLERALELGCYLSVNPAMLRSQKGQRLLENLPRERVLTETDGPFVQISGRAALPWDVLGVLEHFSQMWNLSLEEAQGVVHQNFARVLEGSSPMKLH